MAEVRMPKLGESVTEGTIGRWLKQVGDQVAKYEPLAEVVTDKVSAEIPSDFVGVLTEILVGEDQTVKVGTPLAIIEVAGEVAAPESKVAPADSAAPSTLASTQADTTFVRSEEPEVGTGTKARYSPAVMKMAQERGIDLSQVPGSGLGGRVTRKDVENWQPQALPPAAVRSAPDVMPRQPEVSPAAAFTPVAAVATGASTAQTDEGVQRVPVTPIRKTIARRMVESKHQAPHAWMMMEVDATPLVRLREKQKAAFKAKEGVDLTFLPFFIQAAVGALKEFPIVNSEWAQDDILVKNDVHISIAVATPDALAVPVIHHADRLSIFGLAKAVQDLAQRARVGKLTLADVQGGTFTVNNTGAFGSILSQPIINAPQAAILSVEAIVKRPIVQADDSIAIRSMVNLCMSLDHRILDGWVAGQFMKSIKQRVESYTVDSPLY
ncbi:MAG: dihydrolipoamide acetyltransferase family protein [Firmicutes bacterium]|nr:dihydrolipoamide acetyltransferase family protein [Bacillota bacterium]